MVLLVRNACLSQVRWIICLACDKPRWLQSPVMHSSMRTFKQMRAPLAVGCSLVPRFAVGSYHRELEQPAHVIALLPLIGVHEHQVVAMLSDNLLDPELMQRRGAERYQENTTLR